MDHHHVADGNKGCRAAHKAMLSLRQQFLCVQHKKEHLKLHGEKHLYKPIHQVLFQHMMHSNIHDRTTTLGLANSRKELT